jgi:hypothetical protein
MDNSQTRSSAENEVRFSDEFPGLFEWAIGPMRSARVRVLAVVVFGNGPHVWLYVGVCATCARLSLGFLEKSDRQGRGPFVVARTSYLTEDTRLLLPHFGLFVSSLASLSHRYRARGLNRIRSTTDRISSPLTRHGLLG